MGAIQSVLPLQLFESGQLLCLPKSCRGGLILQHPHHAEFVGAGAAVGGYFDIKCKSVYTIGDVKLESPTQFQDRQRALANRIRYMRQLQKITYLKIPLQRAYLLIRQLHVWLPGEEVIIIPELLLAQLVGVLPKTIAIARRKYILEHGSELFPEEQSPKLMQGLNNKACPIPSPSFQ
jgi:hypothetical protein